MKFVRGLAVVTWVSVALPLVVACGSAGSNGLFSASGGTTSSDKAGASGVSAGASPAGADTGGMSAGGSSEAGAGEPGVAGKGSAGASAGEASGGSVGAGGKGEGGAPSGGSAGAAAGSGGAGAGSGGATAGAGGSTAGNGGGGGIAGSTGGGSGHGVGCPPNNAPTPGAACQVTTPDSCFYSGVACSCQQVGPSTFIRKWACYGTPDKCPDNTPANGSRPCKNGAECPYLGGDYCVCMSGSEPKFGCQPDAAICPLTKPFKGMECQLPVRSCAYADDQCFCNGDSWTCESNSN
jgi:hypothetical protein